MDLAVDQRSDRSGWSLSVAFAEFGLRPVTSLAAQHSVLEHRRAGKIVTSGGRLVAVYGRWWPYFGSLFQAACDRRFRGRRRDRCELFYHTPLTSPGFLTLDYVRTGPRSRTPTLLAAMLVLDEIARLKKSHAIVTQVVNEHIGDRILARYGWQAHCLDWPGRNFIKRFYGQYPEIPKHWRSRLTLE